MASPKDFISLVNSGQKVVYPFRNYLNYLHDKYSDLQTGKIADYIPELALVGFRQKTNREKPQLQSPLGIYFEKPKIAETQIYQGKS